jgi:hypothetical protein
MAPPPDSRKTAGLPIPQHRSATVRPASSTLKEPSRLGLAMGSTDGAIEGVDADAAGLGMTEGGGTAPGVSVEVAPWGDPAQAELAATRATTSDARNS